MDPRGRGPVTVAPLTKFAEGAGLPEGYEGKLCVEGAQLFRAGATHCWPRGATGPSAAEATRAGRAHQEGHTMLRLRNLFCLWCPSSALQRQSLISGQPEGKMFTELLSVIRKQAMNCFGTLEAIMY